MASFSELTPVLLAPHMVRGATRGNWVLWPVHGCRIVAPRPVETPLNLFQRAVLGLCSAGIRQGHAFAARLCIEPDLVLVVLEELRDMRLVDPAGVLTPQGLGMLEDLTEDRLEEPVAGWIFADAISGAWWPRFATGSLPFFLVDQAESPAAPGLASGAKTRRSRLSLGTEGAPLEREALRWEPPNPHPPSPPSPEQILDLLRRQRAHLHRARTLQDDAPRLRGVALVSETCTPFWLALHVVLDGPEALALDPFCGKPDRDLSAWLNSPAHPKVLQEWLTGGRENRVLEGVRILHQLAEEEVERRLTTAIHGFRDEMTALVAMQRALLEAQQDGSPKDKWNDVLVKTQLVLEKIAARLAPRDKQTRKNIEVWFPSRDPAGAHELLSYLATQAGFAPLPRRMTVPPGKVVAALQSGKGSLRPLLMVALLMTREDPSGPLPQLARKDPRFLEKIDAIAGLRDRAAHADAGRKKEGAICQNDIETAVSFAFEAAQAFLLS